MKPSDSRKVTRERTTYRHGDLRRVLLEAGIDLAREGGPEAITLREATRRAGVAPNAAYRHFASHADLFEEVRLRALSMAGAAMLVQVRKIARRRDLDPKHRARETFRAVGMGYMRFALAQPGLFRTAFGAPSLGRPDALKEGQALHAPEGAAGGMQAIAVEGGGDPFVLLSQALDGLVENGLMDRAVRPGAEFLAWSAVHGMSLLLLEGPMQPSKRTQVTRTMQRLLDMVESGLVFRGGNGDGMASSSSAG